MNLHPDPEVKAVFDEIVAHTPELGPAPVGDMVPLADGAAPRRPWLAVAAATIALAGVGGIAVLVDRPAQRTANTTPPTEPAASAAATEPAPTVAPEVAPVRRVSGEPTLYPVLDDVPTGLSVTTHESRVPAGTISTEATLGRVTDGVLADAITIAVQTTPYNISARVDYPATDAEVFGVPATVYDHDDVVLVAWGTGPYYLATGDDPLAFLAEATPGSIRTESTSEDEPLRLMFGALPSGYEVVGGPQAFGGEYTGVTLAIGADNYDVSASPRDLIGPLAQAGPLRRLDVGDRQGWILDSPQAATMIAWQVDATTFAVLKVNDGSSADTALAIAEALAWVDRDTWSARYSRGDDPETTSTGPSTVPPASGDVALGVVEIDGESVSLAIVDDGQLCRLDQDGARQVCHQIVPPSSATPVVRLSDGNLIYGYTLDTVNNLQVTVDGTPLNVVRAGEATQVGDAVLTAWAARLPEPNVAADRIAIEFGG